MVKKCSRPETRSSRSVTKQGLQRLPARGCLSQHMDPWMLLSTATNINKLFACFFQVKMPDVEFFVNLGDWPLEKKKSTSHIHPIFSWCGSTDSKDIVMPTYDLTDSVLETMGR